MAVLDPRFKSDQIFNDVSRLFITLKDNEMKEYNIHLQTVLTVFIEHMKKNPVFQACFRRIAYVGSYYEGLKVGKPEEFDLNVVINLPIAYSRLTTMIALERPGYVKLQADPTILPSLRKHPRWGEYKYYPQTNGLNNDEVESNFKQTSDDNPSKKSDTVSRRWKRLRKSTYKQRAEVESNLKQVPNDNSATKSRAASQRRRRFKKKIMDSWFDEKNHLNQNKFRNWFESVVTKALGSFDNDGGKYLLIANGKTYRLHHKKSGPAWTLKIDVPNGHTVDVDLVPVLEFTTGPSKPFLSHNTQKTNWFTISKPLDGPNNQILWRPSFYERELEILKGSIKQVIRQMKKLRDTQNFKSIASYYIKTLFLHELKKQKDDFQQLPSTFLFFYMLKKLHEACANHEIKDFWNPKNNLLSNITQSEMGNIKSRLNRIINDIDKRIATDEYVVAEYILTKEELVQLKLSRMNSALASTSITSYNKPVQPQQSDGILSGIWSRYWSSGPAPAT